MKSSEANLRVNFYLRKKNSRNGLCPVVGRISTFKILFYLNTSSKKKKSSLCPVMGRITVDGGVAQFSLKEDVHPDCWDTKNGRIKGNSREIIELNRKIDKTEQNIRNIYKQIIDITSVETAGQIRNEITGVTKKSKNLLELFRELNLDFKKQVEIDLQKALLKSRFSGAGLLSGK